MISGHVVWEDEFFTSLSPLHQFRVQCLIEDVINGEFRHKEQIPVGMFDSVSLPSTYLKSLFRRKNDSGYYIPIRDHYFDCIDSSYEFGKRHLTKKYRLKSWVFNKYYEYYSNPEPFKIGIHDTKIFREMDEIPSVGTDRFDILGYPRSTRTNLNPIIKVNSEEIDRTIDELLSSRSILQRDPDRRRNILFLYQWKKVLNNTLLPNRILQLYREGSNGRLNPFRGMNSPHLIKTPNRIRKVLFSGMDLYDYDMSNCHFSLFSNLCDHLGIGCPNINHYLEHKHELRDMWEDQFLIKKKDLKHYILSWFNGGSINEVEGNSYFEKLGYHRLKNIKHDPILSGIYSEIIKGRKKIVNHYRDGGVVRNVLGKEKPSKNYGKDLNFILIGWESKIMELVNHLVGEKMKVLIYDGWIGEKVDTNWLETEIRNQFGFKVKFDEELIEKPPLSSLK